MSPAPFPVSDHCDGRRFFNPAGHAEARSFLDLPRWWWQRLVGPPRGAWPRRLPPPAPPALPVPVPEGTIAVTWVGHATFLIQWSGTTVLTDPMFSSRAGPFGVLGPRRVRPPALPLDRLPPIDLVLLSHNHYDHLDLPSLRWLARERRPRIVTLLGNGRWLAGRGVPGAVELDWWQEHRGVTCTPAQHFSARGPWDRNRTLWGGFALATPAGSVYFAGDSGWCRSFQAIGERLGPFDLALLPIGAYEPRWFMKPVHLNPDEAVLAHRAVRSRRSIGMHFGAFRLTDEAIDAPREGLVEARTRHGVAPSEFDTLEPGETRLFRAETGSRADGATVYSPPIA